MNFASTVLILKMVETVVLISGLEDKGGRQNVVIKCTSASKAAAACIHTYLEKDFLSISRIVYPKASKDARSEKCEKSEVYNKQKHIMMDGPALDNSCNDLKHVHKCLLQELDECDALGPYFDLRHLIFSLKKVMTWLCGRPVTTDTGDPDLTDRNPHTILRSRFLVLLESIQCLECMRMSRPDCVPYSNVRNVTSDVALWNKILRLEVGTEVCPDLKIQVDCMQNGNLLAEACGQLASEIHGNLTSLFLETWCDLAPMTSLKSQASSLIFNLITQVKMSEQNSGELYEKDSDG